MIADHLTLVYHHRDNSRITYAVSEFFKLVKFMIAKDEELNLDIMFMSAMSNLCLKQDDEINTIESLCSSITDRLDLIDNPSKDNHKEVVNQMEYFVDSVYLLD